MRHIRQAWFLITFPFHPVPWNAETQSFGKPNPVWWNVLGTVLLAAIIIYLAWTFFLTSSVMPGEICHYAGGGNLDTDIVCEEVDPSLLPP